jgi:drug/metabolite transporter (DMT)-like permease
MNRRDLFDLLLLGALWGASFLFMRLGAADFGPVALVFVRVAGASVVLLPMLLWRRGGWSALRQHWRAIAVVGVINSALPFVLFTAAALVLSAALMAMLNATAPLFGALVAWLWLKDKLPASRALGLLTGLLGVVVLAWDKADFKAGSHGIIPLWGMVACVLATLLYGVAANVSRRYLVGVPPLAVAAGSQLSAALFLLLPALWWWPAVSPSASAWASAAALALACSAWAYVLYFRLIANVGASQAISVTFLIPAFAMLWGAVFLGELPSARMLLGGAVVLLGTALATGVLQGLFKRGTA